MLSFLQYQLHNSCISNMRRWTLPKDPCSLASCINYKVLGVMKWSAHKTRWSLIGIWLKTISYKIIHSLSLLCHCFCFFFLWFSLVFFAIFCQKTIQIPKIFCFYIDKSLSVFKTQNSVGLIPFMFYFNDSLKFYFNFSWLNPSSEHREEQICKG